ncbi:MAG TPA: Obg family GTPase CgtA, partial [Chloroflexota bacterium]|nr:Obg family GTPase CgtA [Chloroflexota bacterium]
VVARLAELRREEAERAAAAAPTDFETTDDHRVYTPLQESREFYVEQAPDGIYEVTGKAVTRAIQMTDFQNEAAVKYLQTRLRQIGVSDALAKAGVKPGDTVRLADMEMEWLAPPVPPKKRRTAKARKLGVG